MAKNTWNVWRNISSLVMKILVEFREMEGHINGDTSRLGLDFAYVAESSMSAIDGILS